MKSFDDILENGKDKVKKTSVSKTDIWNNHIGVLADTMQKLNEMYKLNSVHNFKIGQINCEKCNIASFTVAIKDIIDENRFVKYHHADWKAFGKAVYYCEICKKGRTK